MARSVKIIEGGSLPLKTFGSSGVSGCLVNVVTPRDCNAILVFRLNLSLEINLFAINVRLKVADVWCGLELSDAARVTLDVVAMGAEE